MFSASRTLRKGGYYETMEVNVTILIAIISCGVGLVGWLYKRDDKRDSEKRVESDCQIRDAEWRGGVNSQLSAITAGNAEIKASLSNMSSRLEESIKSQAVLQADVQGIHNDIKELDGRVGQLERTQKN